MTLANKTAENKEVKVAKVSSKKLKETNNDTQFDKIMKELQKVSDNQKIIIDSLKDLKEIKSKTTVKQKKIKKAENSTAAAAAAVEVKQEKVEIEENTKEATKQKKAKNEENTQEATSAKKSSTLVARVFKSKKNRNQKAGKEQ